MALATGATFAALSSSATLTGNTIGTASANANLLLWDSENEVYAQTAKGFTFTDLTPGEKSDPFQLSFKNEGNVDLNLTARVDGMPELSEGLTGDDVVFKIYGNCQGAPTQATLTELVAGPVSLPCDPIEAGVTGTPQNEKKKWDHKHNNGNYWVKVMISDSVALDDTPETVGAFNIIFDGSAADAPEEPEVPEEPGEEEPPVEEPGEEVPALPEENQVM